MSKKCKFNIDFVGKRKIFLTISAILVLASIALTFTGLKIAIEFKGGTIISYDYSGDLDRAKLDEILSQRIQNSYNIQEGTSFNNNKNTISISFAGGGKFQEADGTATATESEDGMSLIEVPTGDFSYTGENFTAVQQSEMTNALIEAFPDNQIELQDSSNVNPSAGKIFLLKCLTAVGLAALILIIYIALRFRAISGWYAGVCSIIALLHDVIITYGFFIALGFELDSNFMAVILTILGYSINDTIVIYDRIRENSKLHKRMAVPELINLSVNQSLTRSINTSIAATTTMLIVTIVCVASGVTSILSLSVPLFIGMLVGAYSSICVAPVLYVLRKGKGSLEKKEVAEA